MRLGPWLLALTGCPWIPLSEHRENNRALTQADTDPPGDIDADADADTDTDTDADTDTDPQPSCDDDGWEPNGTLLTATEVGDRTSFAGVMCPDDLSPSFGVPLDLYEVEVGGDEVLAVTLGADGSDRCSDQTLGLQITDEVGTVYASAVGRCPTVSSGWGAGTWYVWVTDTTDAAPQSYVLGVERLPCTDLDGDGFLAATCGGPDCSDLQPDRYPGAIDVPADGIDQDCDGGDDLASTCGIVSAGTFEVGTLPCGTLETGAVWDRWEVPVALAGQELSVVVQNEALGGADLLALIVDPDGSTHYGLEADRSQMDDESDCDAPTWTGAVTACPAACVQPTIAGAAQIWVAQWPGAACVADAGYSLLVYGDGTPLVPVAAGDDVLLAFP